MLYEKIKLETGEEIIAMVRKHWWVILSQSLLMLFLALLPVIFLGSIIWLGIFDGILNASSASFMDIQPYLTFAYSAWLLVIWMILFNLWTDHYLDLWTITTRRVIAIDQRGFFRRFISSFRLERLQDMNIEVNGILATLLNYGTIEAQTAGGSNEEFKTNFMPDPRGLKAMIIKAADERQQEAGERILQSDGTL